MEFLLSCLGVEGRNESVELEDEVDVLGEEGFGRRGFFADGVLVEHVVGAHNAENAELQQYVVVIVSFEVGEEVVVLEGFHGVVLNLGHPELLVVGAQDETLGLVYH